MTQLNPFGHSLAESLAWSKSQSQHWKTRHAEEPKVHITSAGKALTAAYEQLRNAAEYVEENLLLQRAISRFYRRLFLARDQRVASESAEDLIVELTLAGYLQNDSVPVAMLETINALAGDYYRVYDQLPAKSRDNANAWVIDVLAVTVEGLLSNHSNQDGFTQFAYDYLYRTLDPKELIGDASNDDYAVSLFIAVNYALMKADAAIIRTGLLARYQATPSNLDAFIATNQRIDALLTADTTEKLTRVVDRRSGSLRILWRMIDSRDDVHALLSTPQSFLNAYEAQIEEEYRRIGQKVRQGIVKSIMFLIITKVAIGLLIEIPYDLIVYDEILWLPLAINLLFPPLYMAFLGATMSMPGHANTRALSQQIEELLYGNAPATIPLRRSRKKFNAAFNVVYALLFLAVFGGAGWLLAQVGLSMLHLVIFFVFLSTASFLGFRLTRAVREIEVVDGDQNALTIGRDLLYMPFVVVGHWISDKYGKVNIMTLVLDVAIELPLKASLNLVRQWTAFISSKKDEL